MRHPGSNDLRPATFNDLPRSFPKWFPFFLAGIGVVSFLGCQLLG